MGYLLMTNVCDIVQRVMEKSIVPREGLCQIDQWIKTSGSRSKASCAYRLCRSLSDLEEKPGSTGWLDVAGHLRQVMLNFQCTFILHPDYNRKMQSVCIDTNLHIDSDGEISVVKRMPSWFGDFENIQKVYNLQPCQTSEAVLGDGTLKDMTGYTHFASRGQKIGVKKAMDLPPGYTLLVCLPTGGGKSTVGRFPAYWATEGGILSGAIDQSGTTLVVVPTIALAIDQAEQAQKCFTNVINEEYKPAAYHSGISIEAQQSIYNGIKMGTIPIVYMSPEKILGRSFRNLILEAARNGKLITLVIDEAHMVSDWGSSFRTDFQFLSSFRKQMLDESGGKLRTILLSATLSDRATELLAQMFSEPGRLISVRGDALRPEPVYFIDHPKNNEQRQERIIEIMPLLPKPVILYVTNPIEAALWKRNLNQAGFASVAIFTGRTGTNKREELVKKWNADQIDIMVATSAFGMGVDKSDIRTVIHDSMPESINSYYQQVGRGGRDGFPFVALLSVVELADYKKAFNLIKHAVLRPGTIAKRWVAMRRQGEFSEGDMVWVDTDCRPPHLSDEETGDPNANFNEVTLLFLYRCNLLDIVDIKYPDSNGRRHIMVKMLDIGALEDEEVLINTVTQLREDEWDAKRGDLRRMNTLTNKNRTRCWSEDFGDVYSYTREVCGGCPSCRMNPGGYDKVKPNLVLEGSDITISAKLTGQLRRWLGYLPEILLYSPKDLVLKTEYISTLIKSGVRTIVLPENEIENLLQFMSSIPVFNHDYTLCGWEEVFNSDLNNSMISGIIAAWYPNTSNYERCYQWLQCYLANVGNQVIHIANDKTMIVSQGKYLTELVEGRYQLEKLTDSIKIQEETVLF